MGGFGNVNDGQAWLTELAWTSFSGWNGHVSWVLQFGGLVVGRIAGVAWTVSQKSVWPPTGTHWIGSLSYLS
jgi:hypothetical protein